MVRYVEIACRAADQRSHKPSTKGFRTGKVAALPEPTEHSHSRGNGVLYATIFASRVPTLSSDWLTSETNSPNTLPEIC